jgi:hypothetical protein
MRDFYFNIPACDRGFRCGALALGHNRNLTETSKTLRRVHARGSVVHKGHL